MFSKTKKIDTAFRHIKMVSIVLVFGCISLAVYALYTSNKTASESQQRIFILANGKALEAYAADRKDNIPVEAKDHVKMFHFYFFSLRCCRGIHGRHRGVVEQSNIRCDDRDDSEFFPSASAVVGNG